MALRYLHEKKQFIISNSLSFQNSPDFKHCLVKVVSIWKSILLVERQEQRLSLIYKEQYEIDPQIFFQKMQPMSFPENKLLLQKNKIFHQIFEENRRSNFSVVNVDVVQRSLRTTNQSSTILKEKDENTFLTNRTILRFVYENKLKIMNSSFVQKQPIRLALRTMSYLTNADHIFKWIQVPQNKHLKVQCRERKQTLETDDEKIVPPKLPLTFLGWDPIGMIWQLFDVRQRQARDVVDMRRTFEWQNLFQV